MYLLVKQTSHPYAKARPYPLRQASLPRGYGRTGAGWSQPWNLLAFAYAAARSRDGHPYTKARPYPLRQASLPPRVRTGLGARLAVMKIIQLLHKNYEFDSFLCP